jgi:hypothetical protein
MSERKRMVDWIHLMMANLEVERACAVGAVWILDSLLDSDKFDCSREPLCVVAFVLAVKLYDDDATGKNFTINRHMVDKCVTYMTLQQFNALERKVLEENLHPFTPFLVWDDLTEKLSDTVRDQVLFLLLACLDNRDLLIRYGYCGVIKAAVCICTSSSFIDKSVEEVRKHTQSIDVKGCVWQAYGHLMPTWPLNKPVNPYNARCTTV